MGRGKPFVKSMKKLVDAGVVAKPIWMDIVQATRPPFVPVAATKVPEIIYPEDRLRSIYLQRNPQARRMPVNLKAKSVTDRHIADRFVSLQVQFMEEQGMSEEKSYEEADRVLAKYKDEMAEALDDQDMDGSLVNQSIRDAGARAFMASVKDSKRDQKLHQELVEQEAKERN
ncbi:Mitochondrial ribosomal protein S23 [Gracilaria domingensis]|nr:Mitochondrial ribosomal protein S23 [Gracilaria domingensis]